MAQNGLSTGGQAAALSIDHQEAILVSKKEAGGDGVDTDVGAVFLGHVDGEPLGEVGDGGFGGAVGGDAGEGAEGVHGGDVDDAAVAAVGYAAAEDLTGLEGAGEVEVEDVVDGLDVEVEEGAVGCGGGLGLVASGGVDEDVDGAEGGGDLFEGLFEVGAVGDVAGDAEGVTAFGLNCVGYFCGGFGVEAEDGDLSAGLGEGVGHGCS